MHYHVFEGITLVTSTPERYVATLLKASIVNISLSLQQQK